MPQAKVLTEKEMRKVLLYCAAHKHAQRNKAMLLMTHLAGMRVGEVAALRLRDVLDSDGGVRSEIKLAADQTKGSRGRTVLVPKRLQELLREYLASRFTAPERAGVARTEKIDHALFPSQNCGHELLHSWQRHADLEGPESHGNRYDLLARIPISTANGEHMSANERAEAVLIVIKRLGMWSLYGVLISATLLGLLLAYWAADNYWESRPRLIQELEGIKIGESLGDVQFKISDLKRSESEANEAGTENYSSDSKRLAVSVKESKINYLAYYCKSEGLEYSSVGSIGCADRSDQITEKYGDDVRILCAKKDGAIDNTVRTYDVVKYGLRYILEQNSVVVLAVIPPALLETYVGRNWFPCSQ